MGLEVVGQSAPEWWKLAFWTRDPASIRDLVLIVGGFFGFLLLLWRTWNVHRQAGAALNQSRAALRQSESALRQAETAAQRHLAQAEADRERRIGDSYRGAMERLGDDKLEARLGAIYALESIARESAQHHWPIMEMLTAYIRERAPWTPEKEDEEKEVMRGALDMTVPATDVQAVLTVIGRRFEEHEREPPAPEGALPKQYPRDLRRLDLRGTDLRRADLRGANVERALFTGAHLEGAQLIQARLRGAVFFDVDLNERTVADLSLHAHLEQADLRFADLTGAVFRCAHLEGADLRGTVLNRTVLDQAHLEGADLRRTDVTDAQIERAFTDENTKLPPHVKRKTGNAPNQ